MHTCTSFSCRGAEAPSGYLRLGKSCGVHVGMSLCPERRGEDKIYLGSFGHFFFKAPRRAAAALLTRALPTQ